MTILANIIGGAALAAMFVVFYALGVSAGREATQQRKEDISMEHIYQTLFMSPTGCRYLNPRR